MRLAAQNESKAAEANSGAKGAGGKEWEANSEAKSVGGKGSGVFTFLSLPYTPVSNELFLAYRFPID